MATRRTQRRGAHQFGGRTPLRGPWRFNLRSGHGNQLPARGYADAYWPEHSLVSYDRDPGQDVREFALSLTTPSSWLTGVHDDNETQATTAGSQQDQSPKRIIVAVDGSENNRSAVSGLLPKPAATGSDIALVTAVEDHLVPTPHFSVRGQDEYVSRRSLSAGADPDGLRARSWLVQRCQQSPAARPGRSGAE